MKPNKRKIIHTVIVTALWLICFCLTISMISRASAMFPTCVCYINRSSEAISFAEISVAKKANTYPATITINAQSIWSTDVHSAEGRYVSAEIIATDETYTDFHSINIVSGTFFTQSEQGAVISENLANSLFSSTDVIGEKLYLSNSEITIIGIYKPSEAFLSKIASNGQDYILIPYTAVQIGDKAEYLYMKSKESDGHVSALDEIDINSILDGRLSQYEKLNLSDSKRTVEQFRELLIFFTGVIIFVVLIKGLLKLIHSARSPSFYVKLICLIILLIIIPIATSFELYIPPNVFPADRNILNLSHYADTFISFIQSQNVSRYYCYSSLYFWSILTFIPLITANLIVAIYVFWKIVHIRSNLFNQGELA